jgi:WD40 repeat protein
LRRTTEYDATIDRATTINVWLRGTSVATVNVPDTREAVPAPDGKSLLVATRGAVLSVDVSSGEASLVANAAGENLAINARGDRFAFRDSRGVLRVWSTSGEELARRPVVGEIFDIAFDPDDDTLAVVSFENDSSGNLDAILTRWDLHPPAAQAMTVAFGAGGVRRSASGGGDLIAIADGQRLRIVHARDAGEDDSFPLPIDATHVAFSANSRYVLILTGSPLVLIADRRKRSLLEMYQGDFVEPGAGVFDPSGDQIAVGDHSGTIRIWRVIDRLELARIQMSDKITNLRFSDDGATLFAAATSARGVQTRGFPVRAEDVVAAACVAILRPLDRDEWNHFLQDEPYRDTCQRGSFEIDAGRAQNASPTLR